MRRTLLCFIGFFSIFLSASAQKQAAKKYPSLFWEITGNGLTKPSYLFGTMHVSSKMVFHLSDSFYYAMRNTDAVALELNPEIWQDEMFKMQRAQINLAGFAAGKMNDYIRESSFQIRRYEDDIKRALTEEPTVVNNLLYRSYQPGADFEENTYLDLYIYQTGRKLGKQPAGVENYLESERLMMEAYQDMAKDKSRKKTEQDGESYFDIQKKIQQAYRNGDLDLMDSLQGVTSMSAAFSEKFLYVRNEIQANSIDTILKKQSLFAGVGAAHLPGPRGVIELLRKKGFRLRPIFMQDRDASQKDEIDKLRVPVAFRTQSTQDGLIQLQLPGKLYKREEARGNESWQYADMNNGSYYMLTRVRTHAAIAGHTERTVLHKVDSMLYENIPGKILNKALISVNGYTGYDVTNRTRRGDLQRYQIIVTPYEVLVFKMSGSDTYVDGKEADQFFGSIKVKPATINDWDQYEPPQGGFKVRFPGLVSAVLNNDQSDGTGRWEYESADNTTGTGYMIWKKSLHNFTFLEEDTFELNMMEESFKSSEIVNKQLSRSLGTKHKYPFLKSKFSLKDGGYITIRAFIRGPHYFVMGIMSRDKRMTGSSFFNSFKFAPLKYPSPKYYVDSTLKLKVFTAVKPNLDTTLRSWMEKAYSEPSFGFGTSYSDQPRTKTGIFKSDSTGESIQVTLQTFPKYYSADPATFWMDKLGEKPSEKNMICKTKKFFKLNDSVSGYKIILSDTNSSRCIRSTYYLQANNLIKISSITDTLSEASKFIKNFFETAKPVAGGTGTSIYDNKSAAFFKDFASKDSSLNNSAKEAISYIRFKKDDVSELVSVINNLKYNDQDYYDTKSKLITALGYIEDSSAKEQVVSILRTYYEKNVDTAYFQNAVLSSLSLLKTKSAYSLLKELLVQDPPVFDNSYEYGRIFDPFFDSLQLAKTLLPEVIQLASLEDYKPYVNSLLKFLVDSGYIIAADYENYFSKLSFDAKTELKKQQNKEEKQLDLQKNEGEYDREAEASYSYIHKDYFDYSSATSSSDYAALLIPFYDKYSSVPKYFEKLLASKDLSIQLAAARLMIVNNKKIPDSLFACVASQDKYRAKLWKMLSDIKRSDLFPQQYKNQEMIARSLLLNDKNYKEFAAIELYERRMVRLQKKTGYVYLFKYKVSKEDEWKVGVSGVQSIDLKEVNTNTDLVKMTGRKIKTNEPLSEQFENQIKRVKFAKHKSFSRFYENSNPYFLKTSFDD